MRGFTQGTSHTDVFSVKRHSLQPLVSENMQPAVTRIEHFQKKTMHAILFLRRLVMCAKGHIVVSITGSGKNMSTK